MSFTAVRLGSGAVMLGLIAAARRSMPSGSWISGLALFAYAIFFSIAYLRIGAAIGALVLFGAVQVTMIGAGIRAGDRPSALEWLGFVTALAALVALTVPGASSPDLFGVFLMTVAGAAWGLYSLRGRGEAAPLAATSGNFLRAAPIAIAAAAAVAARGANATRGGVLLAVLSGALASGAGYSLWYAAVPSLEPMTAALLQLLVPVIAAAGAIAVLHEPPSVRLLAAVPLVGGVALALLARRAASKRV